MSTVTANVNTEEGGFAVAEMLYQDAVALVRQTGKASIRLLTDHFAVKSPRAVAMLDRMEAEGIVGPSVGGQARQVIGGQKSDGKTTTDGGSGESPEQAPESDTGAGVAIQRAPLLTITDAQPAAIADGTTVEIDIDFLAPSPTNPRKSFPEAELQELAQSIASVGLISPLVVRVRQQDIHDVVVFEIVAGERRYRACKLLQHERIPCIVRTLSDADVVKVQIIENLHRADVHPLEEAAGYRRLMELGDTGDEKLGVEAIAKDVGKSVSYIWQRLKLLALTADAAEAFQKGEMTASHAVDCARLEPRDQAEYMRVLRKDSPFHEPSFREMHKWIADHVRIDLVQAPFDLKDPDLLPGAPACTACGKCSIAQAELFGDFFDQMPTGHKRKKGEKVAALCMDSPCYSRKLGQFLNDQRIRFEAESGKEAGLVWMGERWSKPEGNEYKGMPVLNGDFVEAKPDECDWSVPAVSAGGETTAAPGRKLWICANPKCPKHHGSTKAANDCHDTGMGPINPDSEAHRAEVAAEEARRRIERAAREEAFRQIRQAMRNQRRSIGDYRDIALWAFERLHFDEKQRLEELLNLREKAPTISVFLTRLSKGSCLAFVMFCALAQDFTNMAAAPTSLKVTGIGYGVSLDTIRERLQKADTLKTKAKKGGR